MGQPSIHVLSSLEYYLERHFESGMPLMTAEIGGSDFRATFEKHSRRHVVFGDTDVLRTSYGRTAFHVFYVGGAHGFLDLAESLRLAIAALADVAVLVLPHIDVPTTHFCFQYLKEADGLTLHFTMENTAFFGFQRTGSFAGGGWIREGFNARNYPAFDHLAYAIRPQIPLLLKFDGYSASSDDKLERGFMVRSGRVYSEGSHSRLRLLVRPGKPEPVEVRLRLRPVATRRRANAAVDVRISYGQPTSHVVGASDDFTARAQIVLPEDGAVVVDLFHHGLVEASQLDERQIDMPACSRPNIELIEVSIRPVADTAPQRSISRHVGQVSTFTYANQTFRFFVDDPHDSIQAHHHAGEFYELEELELIGRHLAPGARILDVGANIGNHTVYFERVLLASRVVPIELQPRVIKVLQLNVALNGLTKTDLSKLGVGFGDSTHQASIHIPQLFNVAGAQFETDSDGRFTIAKGDDVLAGEAFDLLKIDIEGMECEAIDGLAATIARSQPLLFVEVWNENQARFKAQMEDMGYVVAEEWRRYDVATNLLMRHRDAV